MAAPEFPVVRFFYRLSDGAWLGRVDTGGRPMSMTIEQAKVHASAEYGFPVGIVEADDIPYAEYHDHLRPATHWGGRPPDRPHVDYTAPERLLPPRPPSSLGPAGPAGPRGAAGPAGPRGATGAMGATGTIGVTYVIETTGSTKDALSRMTEAYEKIFALEVTYRSFIEATLYTHFGLAWWNQAKINKDIQDRVVKHKEDPTNLWFEDFGTSDLRFTFFDDLRRIILTNWEVFEQYIGDRDWFDSTMRYLRRPRDRIAHFRTLSTRDHGIFMENADRLLSLVPPETMQL